MRTTSVLGVLVLGLSLTACGDNVTKREATRGWRSAQTAMTTAGVGAASVSVSGSVGPNGASGSVEGTFDCPDGGSLELVAAGDASSEGASSSLHIEFFDCKADRVTTNGVLDYDASVTSSEVSVSYAGELEWTGRARGTCVVDASLTVSASSISANYSGDVCGFSWGELG